MRTIIAALALLVAGSAYADRKECQSVFNPMSGQWEWQCVEREENEYAPPKCRLEYDPMNNQWHQVCE